jgi:hypothetical protein
MLVLTSSPSYQSTRMASRRSKKSFVRKTMPYVNYLDNGKIDLASTIQKFNIDLEAATIFSRQGLLLTPNVLEEYQLMANLDIELVNSWVAEEGGYAKLNKASIGKVSGKFTAYLTENAEAWAKEEEARSNRAKNRRSNVFKAYKQLGRDIAPEPTIIMSVMLLSAVSPSDIEEEQEAIKEEIQEMIGEEILGRIQGPGGGLGLGKDEKGKLTDLAPKLTFGKIVRQGKPPKA